MNEPWFLRLRTWLGQHPELAWLDRAIVAVVVALDRFGDWLDGRRQRLVRRAAAPASDGGPSASAAA
ncbi:MAG: hypothetical protein WAM30_04605, partial [Candidatus Dormiibacterota bacterium]